MWVMFERGFVSAVQDRDDHSIVRVRARDKISLKQTLEVIENSGHDIDGLEIVEGIGTDYRWRVSMPKELFAVFVSEVATNISYGNFKDHVTKTRGQKWHDALMDVWVAMLAVNDKKPVRKSWGAQLYR
jgi:hypothetical protein